MPSERKSFFYIFPSYLVLSSRTEHHCCPSGAQPSTPPPPDPVGDKGQRQSSMLLSSRPSLVCIHQPGCDVALSPQPPNHTTGQACDSRGPGEETQARGTCLLHSCPCPFLTGHLSWLSVPSGSRLESANGRPWQKRGGREEERSQGFLLAFSAVCGVSRRTASTPTFC